MPDGKVNRGRPNILLIMTDQQRGDCLGCDGHPVQETPYLDQIASEGIRFSRAYSATPSCIPARATLLTGMRQWHTGILGMGEGQGLIRTDYRHTLPGELAKAGYHTQAIGKNHFSPQRALNGYHNCILDESGRAEAGFVSDYRQWFDQNKDGPYSYRDHSIDWNSWMARPTHLPEHLHPTHWTAQQAIEWLDRRDPGKPFFLKVSFARPHSPYDPPQVYYDMYKNRPMPAPFLGEWSEQWHGPAALASADINAWRSQRAAHEIQRARAAYYASITFIDHQIGRILYEMQNNHAEALKNTLIIFLSDHGDMMGDHHLWRKTYAYEGSARIPLILKPPTTWNMQQGLVSENVVEIRDIMPTLLDAAGVEIPDTVDGQSMLPLARNEKVSWRSWLHGQHVRCYSHEQANHYLTDGKEKYIWFPHLAIEQFFDLTSDPGEQNNLAVDPLHAERLKIWRRRLIRKFEEDEYTQALEERGLRTLAPKEVEHSPHYGIYGCLDARADSRSPTGRRSTA